MLSGKVLSYDESKQSRSEWPPQSGWEIARVHPTPPKDGKWQFVTVTVLMVLSKLSTLNSVEAKAQAVMNKLLRKVAWAISKREVVLACTTRLASPGSACPRPTSDAASLLPLMLMLVQVQVLVLALTLVLAFACNSD